MEDLINKLEQASKEEQWKIYAQLDYEFDRTVTLKPIAMIVPNKEGIYTSNKLEKPKVISQTEFLLKYSDHPKPIKVSEDGKNNWQIITAYGYGLDCWYIL